MSNFDENTKAVENEDLNGAEENDVNQDLEGQEPANVVETTAWQDICNGVKGVGRGVKKGTLNLWHDHKGKIIGGIIGGKIVYDKVIKPAWNAHKNNNQIDAVETTEIPLLEVEPEPEYPEVCGFMYDKDMNEHVFNSKEEALDTLNSIVPDEEPVEEPTDNNVEVGPEVTE